MSPAHDPDMEEKNWLTLGRDVATAYPRFSGSISMKRVNELLAIVPEEGEEGKVPTWVATDSRYGDDWVEKPYPMEGLEQVSAEYLWGTRQFVLSQLASRGLTVGKKMSVSERQEWDRVVGRALFERLDFDIFEAFDEDVWTYLTVFLFWDFPQWRFPGKVFEANKVTEEQKGVADESPTRPSDRVLGGSRNVLFRTWLRVYALGPDFAAEGEVDFAGEDILDNLFGRPSISQNHVFSREILRTLYRNEPHEGTDRRRVFREFMKAIRRRTATINFTATGSLLDRELDKLWNDAKIEANRSRVR
jgi:hypothetical protein